MMLEAANAPLGIQSQSFVPGTSVPPTSVTDLSASSALARRALMQMRRPALVTVIGGSDDGFDGRFCGCISDAIVVGVTRGDATRDHGRRQTSFLPFVARTLFCRELRSGRRLRAMHQVIHKC